MSIVRLRVTATPTILLREDEDPHGSYEGVVDIAADDDLIAVSLEGYTPLDLNQASVHVVAVTLDHEEDTDDPRTKLPDSPDE